MTLEEQSFKEALLRAASQNGIEALLDGEKAKRFYDLTARMLTVNEQFNLTAITDPSRIIFLH